MNSPNFWDDQNKANGVISELNLLKKTIDNITLLKNKVESNLEMSNCDDEEMLDLINNEIDDIKKQLVRPLLQSEF